MNRSYSKLRHIQKSNTLLEQRLMNEKSKILNESHEDDDDFGFESPFCPQCNGNGCEECDGSGMKRNPVTKEKDVDESYWDKLFGSPTIKDAAHDSLRGQGHSHTGKDESNELYVVFQGQNFYPSDIEYAGPEDMGEIPRIEGDKLIVANPAWNL